MTLRVIQLNDAKPHHDRLQALDLQGCSGTDSDRPSSDVDQATLAAHASDLLEPMACRP
jgi:hypothetical protein